MRTIRKFFYGPLMTTSKLTSSSYPEAVKDAVASSPFINNLCACTQCYCIFHST